MEQVHANHGAGDVTLRVTLYLFCAKVSRAQESARAAALARSSLSLSFSFAVAGYMKAPCSAP
jgi:hypothetical protein